MLSMYMCIHKWGINGNLESYEHFQNYNSDLISVGYARKLKYNLMTTWGNKNVLYN